MERFKLGFIGCGGSEPSFGIGSQVVTGVECDGQRSPALGAGEADEVGSSDAEAVIGNRNSIGGTKMCLQSLLQFPACSFRQSRLRLTIDSEDLLADGVCPSGEEAGLGRSTPVFNTQDSGNVDAFVAEVGEKSISGGIIADGGDR